jgi:hypothetical protein
MLRDRSSFSDTVNITCLENNKTVLAEILDFKRAYMLTVSVDRKVKLNLRYNTEKKLYIGNVGNLEFITEGPKETVVAQGRKR